jgi:hypothetical protein
MPTLHMDRIRCGKFYTILVPGMIREYGYAPKESGTVEPRPDGKIAPWAFQFCARHIMVGAASDLLKGYKDEILKPSQEDIEQYCPDFEAGYVEEILVKAVPITLSEDEVVIGRAQAVIDRFPNDILYSRDYNGRSLHMYTSAFAEIESIQVEELYPEGKTHKIKIHDGGYLAPRTEKSILDAFIVATKELEVGQDMDISDFRISAFIKAASYSRTNLNGVVEDFPWEDDGVWSTMTQAEKTPSGL